MKNTYTSKQITDLVEDAVTEHLRNYKGYDINLPFTEMGADSLDLVEMLMLLEEELNIIIEDHQAIDLKTPANVIEFLATVVDIIVVDEPKEPEEKHPFTIINWCDCDARIKLIELGFEEMPPAEGKTYSINHLPKGDADIWETAKEIFESGLNVMLFHSGDHICIAADTKRFQQR